MTLSVDRVGVVGLGAIGAMALLSLARRGVDVTGFEQSTVGHDEGAFGGGTRRLRLATPGRHGRQHVGLAEQSLRLWLRLERDSKHTLYMPTGELGIGPSDDPDISSLEECLRAEDLDCEVLSPPEVSRRFPQHVLAADEIGVYSRAGGVLLSNRGVHAGAREAQRIGAVVHERSRVQAIAEITDGVCLTVNGERQTFDHVVITAGPWVSGLVPAMQSTVTIRRIVSTWFEPTSGESFGPNNFPPGFRRSRSGQSFTFLPGIEGSTAKFIFWIPQRPVIEDPYAWERTADHDHATVESTCRALAGTMRGAAAEPSRVESYMEGFTADRWPLVGRLGDHLTLLAGFSGNGFALAPVMGEAAADLALQGTTAVNIEGMSPSRFERSTAEVQQIG